MNTQSNYTRFLYENKVVFTHQQQPNQTKSKANVTKGNDTCSIHLLPFRVDPRCDQCVRCTMNSVQQCIHWWSALAHTYLTTFDRRVVRIQAVSAHISHCRVFSHLMLVKRIRSVFFLLQLGFTSFALAFFVFSQLIHFFSI